MAVQRCSLLMVDHRTGSFTLRMPSLDALTVRTALSMFASRRSHVFLLMLAQIARPSTRPRTVSVLLPPRPRDSLENSDFAWYDPAMPGTDEHVCESNSQVHIRPGCTRRKFCDPTKSPTHRRAQRRLSSLPFGCTAWSPLLLLSTFHDDGWIACVLRLVPHVTRQTPLRQSPSIANWGLVTMQVPVQDAAR